MGEDKREKIMDAALELFAERGFHGTSVAQIAEKAQVGAGTIYRYFRDKEVLVNELYRKWKNAFHETTKGILDSDDPPRLKFRRIYRQPIQFIRKNPNAIKFLEFHHHAPYLDAESRELSENFTRGLKVFLRGLTEAEVIKDAPPEVLMHMMIGMLMATEKAIMNGDIEPTPENEAIIEQVLWEAVRR